MRDELHALFCLFGLLAIAVAVILFANWFIGYGWENCRAIGHTWLYCVGHWGRLF